MKRPLSRLLAFTGSVALGLVGAVALASPASAHHTSISGTAECTPTEWVITWTVKNWETGMTAKLVKVEADPNNPITDITVGATLPGSVQKGGGWAYGELVGKQTVPLDTTEAKLKIKATWSNNHTPKEPNEGIVTLNRDDCGRYKADVTGTAKCDGDTGNWLVTWAVTNKHYSKDAIAKIITSKKDNGPDDTSSAVRTDTTWTPLAKEKVIVGLKDNDTIAAGASTTATQTVAGTANAARLKVRLTWAKNDLQTKSHATYAVVEFVGDCVKNAAKPSVVFVSDCTGAVTVTLLNNQSATKDATFAVAVGATTTEYVVQPGQSVPVPVPASAKDQQIKVSESGTPLDSYTWKDSAACHPAEITSAYTCDGLTITINNPQGGAEATVVLTPAGKDGTAITKVVAPGTTETVHFDVDEALTVGLTVNGNAAGEVVWQRPRGCEPVGGEIMDTCTGLVFDLKNHEDGSTTEITLTPSKGEAVTFTLKPGEAKKIEFLADGTKLTVTVTLNGKTVDTVEWEKPEDCATPSPSAPPVLAVTGTNTSIYLLIGAVLVAIGAVLFMVARRRRLNMNDAV